MDPQVILVPQEVEDGVRDGANAQLDASAVLNEAGTVAADLLLDLSHGKDGAEEEGFVTLHRQVDVVDVDQGVSIGPGHVAVDLGDDQFGAFRDAFGIVYRDAVRAVPLLIGRGEGDKGHINGDDPLIKQPGGLPKEVGGIVSPTFVDRIPTAGAGEQGVVPKVAGHLRLGVFAGAQGQHVDDLHVLIGLVVINHRVDQGLGFPHAVGQSNPVAGMDVLHCLLGCHELCHITILLPVALAAGRRPLDSCSIAVRKRNVKRGILKPGIEKIQHSPPPASCLTCCRNCRAAGERVLACLQATPICRVAGGSSSRTSRW